MSKNLFSKLIGQENVSTLLVKYIEQILEANSNNTLENINQSWLFVGPMGSGRSISAEYFACGLMCEGKTIACGICKSCQTILKNIHPDMYKVNPAGLSISVDEIRKIVLFANKQPMVGRFQIVLVEDADRLTESGMNALLKSLEEPARKTFYLLCAPSAAPEDIPLTVTSRCQIVNMNTPSNAAIAEYLKELGIEKNKSDWAAKISFGHIGRAKRFATDEESVELRNLGLNILLSSFKKNHFKNILQLLKLIDQIIKKTSLKEKLEKIRLQRDLIDLALLDLETLFRDFIIASFNSKQMINNVDKLDIIDWFINNYDLQDFLSGIEFIQQSRDFLERSVKPIFVLDSLASNLHLLFSKEKLPL